MTILAGGLATIYLTYLACYATILDEPRSHAISVRFLRDLLSCPFCTGLWAAAIVALLPVQIVTVLALAGANFIYWSIGVSDDSNK